MIKSYCSKTKWSYFTFQEKTKRMSSEKYFKILETLKQISDRQEEHRQMYVANQEQKSAAECVSKFVHAQTSYLAHISEMMSLIKVTVEDTDESG